VYKRRRKIVKFAGSILIPGMKKGITRTIEARLYPYFQVFIPGVDSP
jgi:hypothetical protein